MKRITIEMPQMELGMISYLITTELLNSKGTGDEKTWKYIHETWSKAMKNSRNVKSKSL